MYLVKLPLKSKFDDFYVEKWHVKPGEAVKKGAVLCELIAPDAKAELQSPQSGSVLKILAAEGAILIPGQSVAVIGQAGEQVPEGMFEPKTKTADKKSPDIQTEAPVSISETKQTAAQPKAPTQAKAPAGLVTPILLPQAGQSMEEGTIIAWKVKEGDRIEVGQIIMEIETDKATMEVEAVDAGRLAKIVVFEGQTVDVKTPVAYLAESEADVNAYLGQQSGEATAPMPAPQAASAAPAELPAGVTPILMPQAGQSMEEGTIIAWKVKEGDRIEVGQVIMEIETDKATMEVEAVVAGRLSRIVVREGETVDVKVPVAYLAEDDAQVDAYLATQPSQGPAAAPSAASAAAASTAAFQATQTAAAVSETGRIKASPAARKLAAEKGINLSAVAAGSGPGGRILSTDLGSVQPAAAPAAASGAKRVPLSKMRKAIAQNLSYSKQTIPHFYAKLTINAGPLEETYRQTKMKFKCSINDFVTRACAKAIRQYPAFRSQYKDNEILEFASVNIGIAVGTDQGLTVPVVIDADKLSLQELAQKTRSVVENARNGKLEGMGKGLFTISNLGMFGTEEFSAIINPPEAAILAVGAIVEKPVVENGTIKAGKLMTMTLSVDHRVIDGVAAARFLQTLRELLENPQTLAE